MSDRSENLNLDAVSARLAEALRSLQPQPAHLTRDALLFEAGKAAGRSRVPSWVWPSATGLFASISLVLAGFLVSPGNSANLPPRVEVIYLPAPVERVEPASPPASPRGPESSVLAGSSTSPDVARNLQIRRDALRWGVDMLPSTPVAAPTRSRAEAEREAARWLDLPPGTFAVPRISQTGPLREDDE